MSDLKTIQQDFIRLLQGQSSDMLGHVQNQAPVASEVRLGNYQNAYVSRLRETINTDHPILGSYLGDELFEQLVVQYIEQFPSSYPSLRDFCQHIPQFLRQNSPFCDHPILAELAQFEQLLINAFDASDVEPIAANILTTIPPQAWPSMTVEFSPSLFELTVDWNSVQSWQNLKQQLAPPAPSQLAAPAVWILWRNQQRLTEFRSLEPDEARLLALAVKRSDFAELCDELLHWHAPEAAAQRAVDILQLWINQGLVCKLNS